MIDCAEPMIIDKIESINSSENMHKQMKVIPSVDTTLLCGVLDFSGKKYYLDFSDFNKFILEDKRLNFINNSDVYPSYLHNYKRFSLLELLFSYNSSNINYILLSIIIIPLVLFTYVRALSQSFDRHKKLARITFPLWLSVAVTGVVVYLMIAPYYVN